MRPPCNLRGGREREIGGERESERWETQKREKRNDTIRWVEHVRGFGGRDLRSRVGLTHLVRSRDVYKREGGKDGERGREREREQERERGKS